MGDEWMSMQEIANYLRRNEGYSFNVQQLTCVLAANEKTIRNHLLNMRKHHRFKEYIVVEYEIKDGRTISFYSYK